MSTGEKLHGLLMAVGVLLAISTGLTETQALLAAAAMNAVFYLKG